MNLEEKCPSDSFFPPKNRKKMTVHKSRAMKNIRELVESRPTVPETHAQARHVLKRRNRAEASLRRMHLWTASHTLSKSNYHKSFLHYVSVECNRSIPRPKARCCAHVYVFTNSWSFLREPLYKVQVAADRTTVEGKVSLLYFASGQHNGPPPPS